MKLKEIKLNWTDLTTQLESFTTILPYKKIVDNPELVRYVFLFNEEPYVVDFDYRYAKTEKFAVLTFYVAKDDSSREYGDMNQAKYAGPCFGTVLDIVKKEKSTWNVICFTGAESRVGIYHHLFNKHAADTFKYNYLLPDNCMLYIVSKIEIPKNELPIIKNIAADIINSK
jgi:hypothetical protein